MCSAFPNTYKQGRSKGICNFFNILIRKIVAAYLYI